MSSQNPALRLTPVIPSKRAVTLLQTSNESNHASGQFLSSFVCQHFCLAAPSLSNLSVASKMQRTSKALMVQVATSLPKELQLSMSSSLHDLAAN